jgi:signal transduction histidine kinase/DNA-binding NarL/FixJ family response regulator
MTESDRPQRRLKTLLTVPFVALILAPAVIIALSSLYTGLKAVDALSSRVITDVSSRAELAAIHQLEEAAVMLRSTVADPEHSHGSSVALFRDPELLEKKLFEMSAGTRTTGYFFYGAEDGLFVGVDRGRPGAQAAATVRLRGPSNEPRKIYSARTPGDRMRLLEIETRLYDPRNRSWYRNAKQANRLTWTPIYVSFASGALVTTASQPVVGSNGRLLGVLAADVELSELSAFMKTVSVSDNGVAFIVDREGYLVASSSPGLPFFSSGSEQMRVRATDVKNEVERAAALWWSRTRSKPANDVSSQESGVASAMAHSAKIETAEGAVLDVASQRISGIDGVSWDVVVAIPRTDLTAPIVRSAVLMFFVIVTALAAALQLGLWIVRRVSRDVEQLALAADRYGRTDMEFIPPKTTLRETSVLSTAFASMFTRLRDSLVTIKRQNEELAALNASLEERVNRRTQQLESKNLELTAEMVRREQLESELRTASEAATRQADNKVRFMAMLGHELRTPLQAVITTSELLGRDTEVNATHNATLRAASQSLLTLVDSVLSYAKLEAGRVDPEYAPFDVRKAVDEAIRVARMSRPECLANVTAEFTTDVPVWIETDRGIFRQILINLLGNSLRHAPTGNIAIRVANGPASRVEGAPHDERSRAFSLCVTVVDDGPGIPNEARDTLFHPFQQLGRGNIDPAQGSGLGLAICALLARALEGDIVLVNDGIQGTRIDFSIHALYVSDAIVRMLERTESVGVDDPVPRPTRGRLLLLVEDNAVNLRLLSELLAIDHHRVVACCSGEEALASVNESLGAGASQQDAALLACDLVLMDLNLPGISGVETVRELQRLYGAHGLRMPVFVALTASTREEVREECANVGIHRFLTKPATLGQLRALIDELPDAIDSVELPSTDAPVLDASVLRRLLVVETHAAKPFVDDLVRQFLDTVEIDVGHLLAAISAREPTSVRQYAHALSGAALAVGAHELDQVCRVAATEMSAARIRGATDRVKVALDTWRDQHGRADRSKAP